MLHLQTVAAGDNIANILQKRFDIHVSWTSPVFQVSLRNSPSPREVPRYKKRKKDSPRVAFFERKSTNKL